MGIWWIWYAILIVIGILFVLISGKLDKKFNGNNKLKKVILVFSIAVILISIIGIIAYVIGNETEDINNNEITKTIHIMHFHFGVINLSNIFWITNITIPIIVPITDILTIV